MRKRTIALIATVLAAVALIPVLAGDERGKPDPQPSNGREVQVTLSPVADTTISQVVQDGDLSAKTTLATCPTSCENNTAGRRDAQLRFSVTTLPASATDVHATLRVYSWQDYPARVSVGDAQLPAVRTGFNEFPVSLGNGTFTLSQEGYDQRIYWASEENADPALRPQLVVSYRQAGWKLVWGDEFDGGTLDRSKWNLRNGEGRDIDLGCNVDSPANTFVSGGMLTLRALRQSVACGSRTRQFTQSYLDTMGRASWQYGRFEIRAKSPTTATGSTGLWPAFWLRPDDGGNGEIDVTELPGGGAWYDKATASIFWDYTPVKQDVRIPLPGGALASDGFHTYATEWTADSLKWYIDDQLVWTRDRTTTPWFDQAFHKPYNIRLNTQVGGWLGTPDAATVFPADFVVDYVRVYQ
ncbi:hypothetical protein GCM10010435_06660 [Winogradskya consettensis]|uniref:GH16 domain-containing protein n=1 Tax=Winogradskya consettensis TaxID=113560 RepID=A0A919SN45_9ACTN|nr:glycoside hydrolase family 16 protein [Actinoplanes consettensis]GIM75885.1 hypothetical protein Aco04nite_47580 [Actinoplanes consettensis]